jgi:hypothetical protein
MAGMGQHGEAQEAAQHHEAGHTSPVVEWEVTMNALNRRSSPKNMFWDLIDRKTGAENHTIDWRFSVGDRVKAAHRERS